MFEAPPVAEATENVPNAPPTETFGLGVDVRDPTKTVRGSDAPTNVANSVPSFADPSVGSE